MRVKTVFTIEKILENDSIVLLNDGHFTRHNIEMHNSFSGIDLSIASTSFGGSIDWIIQTSYNNNDHWPITLKLFKSQPIGIQLKNGFYEIPTGPIFLTLSNLLAADQFETLLQPNLSTNIDNMVEIFSSIITESTECTTGRSQPYFQKKGFPVE